MVKDGDFLNWRNAYFRSSRSSLEPQGHAHVTISLSAKIRHRAFEGRDVAQTTDRQFTRGLRIDATVDKFTRPHLDVQREFLVDLLIDWHAPEPRT